MLAGSPQFHGYLSKAFFRMHMSSSNSAMQPMQQMLEDASMSKLIVGYEIRCKQTIQIICVESHTVFNGHEMPSVPCLSVVGHFAT